MKFKLGKYQIRLSNQNHFSPGSADNADHFAKIYSLDEDYENSTQIGIQIFDNDEIVSSAMIGATGGASGIHKTSQIVKGNRITICCSDTVFCLSIPELELNWKIKSDEATCFEIFELKEDYIVHGELEISRISWNGEIVWQRAGADIFTTLEGKDDDFLVAEDSIIATDWENRKYRFDFDGNEIRT